MTTVKLLIVPQECVGVRPPNHAQHGPRSQSLVSGKMPLSGIVGNLALYISKMPSISSLTVKGMPEAPMDFVNRPWPYGVRSQVMVSGCSATSTLKCASSNGSIVTRSLTLKVSSFMQKLKPLPSLNVHMSLPRASLHDVC